MIEVRKARAALGQGWAGNRPETRGRRGWRTCYSFVNQRGMYPGGISHIYGNGFSLLYPRGSRMAGGRGGGSSTASSSSAAGYSEVPKFEIKFCLVAGLM